MRVLLSVWLSACGGWSDIGQAPPHADADRDKDGLPDVQEIAAGTGPDNPDSDGDGQLDGIEVFRLRTDPRNPDSDGDGAWDGQEAAVFHTDPNVYNPEHGGSDANGAAVVTQAAPPEVPPDKPLPTTARCGAPGATSACYTYIPGGTFWMGAQRADANQPGYDAHARDEEGPVHRVTLGAFWIMKYEVQTHHYERCVKSRGCLHGDWTTGGYFNYGREEQTQHPINGVTWEGAARFCTWMGGRLPTEAEWEFSARGVEGRAWPWGNFPNCGIAPVDISSVAATAASFRDLENEPVATCDNDGTAGIGRLRGPSPFNLFGMAGNVWEWVNDAYAPYEAAPAENPMNAPTGDIRVQRGGGWTSIEAVELRSAARAQMKMDAKMADVGFRCVRPVVGDAP